MDIRRFLSKWWPVILGLTVLSYFSYHALMGERGILKYTHIASLLEEKELELIHLKSKREALEKKVKGLHPQNLDLDFLEERAMEVLNYYHPNHLVIIEQNTPSK